MYRILRYFIIPWNAHRHRVAKTKSTPSGEGEREVDVGHDWWVRWQIFLIHDAQLDPCWQKRCHYNKIELTYGGAIPWWMRYSRGSASARNNFFQFFMRQNVRSGRDDKDSRINRAARARPRVIEPATVWPSERASSLSSPSPDKVVSFLSASRSQVR